MTPLPIDAPTGWTSPKLPVPRSDALGDQPPNLLGRQRRENLVAEGAARQRIDELQSEDGRDLPDLFFGEFTRAGNLALNYVFRILSPSAVAGA